MTVQTLTFLIHGDASGGFQAPGYYNYRGMAARASQKKANLEM